MKLVLHIGTAKTGTSTLQELLDKNRNKLIENGFYFLRSFGLRNNRSLPSICLQADKYDDYYKDRNIHDIDSKNEHKEKILENFNQEMCSLSPHIHTVICSSEHLHSRTKSIEEISNVKRVLAPYFDEITVLCYIREQADTCVSLYSTGIKFGILDSIWDSIKACRKKNTYYNYCELMDRWARVFGKDRITLRLFCKDYFVNKNLIDDFIYAVTGSSCLDLDRTIENENSSLSLLGAQLGRAVNTLFPRYLPNGSVCRTRERLIREIYKNFSGNFQPFTQEQYDEIYNHFKESNERVFSEFLSSDYGLSNFRQRTLKHEHAYSVTTEDSEKLSDFFSLMIDDKSKIEGSEATLCRDSALFMAKHGQLDKAIKLLILGLKIRPSGDFMKLKLKEFQALKEE